MLTKCLRLSSQYRLLILLKKSTVSLVKCWYCGLLIDKDGLKIGLSDNEGVRKSCEP